MAVSAVVAGYLTCAAPVRDAAMQAMGPAHGIYLCQQRLSRGFVSGREATSGVEHDVAVVYIGRWHGQDDQPPLTSPTHFM